MEYCALRTFHRTHHNAYFLVSLFKQQLSLHTKTANNIRVKKPGDIHPERLRMGVR